VTRLGAIVPPGQTMTQFALRSAQSHRAVSTIIPGARNAGQARSNCETNQMPPMPETELEAIDKIVPPGGGRKIWPA
jgi:aryl-alcohol dehydrogenase-like predicted oxidoreductase